MDASQFPKGDFRAPVPVISPGLTYGSVTDKLTNMVLTTHTPLAWFGIMGFGFTLLSGLVVALWLTWWAWDYFRYALRVWKLSPTRYIPTFYAECSLFIGLALMTIFGSVHLIRNVRRLLASPAEAQGV